MYFIRFIDHSEVLMKYLYGKAAPLKRNKKMVELCDIALIIWDGSSKGTKHTIDYVTKIGKRMILITESTK